MAKTSSDLDTPFKKGEKVLLTRQLRHLAAGTEGKVQLCNGLGNWTRYWVVFGDSEQVGHIDHGDLVRPTQFTQWQEREEQRKIDSQKKAEPKADEAAASGGETGSASGVPAHLIERSKAAKARLLG